MMSDRERLEKMQNFISSAIKRPVELQPMGINPDGSPKKFKELVDFENFDIKDLLREVQKAEKGDKILWQAYSLTYPKFAEGVSLITGKEINVRVKE